MSGLLEGRGTRGRNWFDGVLAAAMAVGVVLGVIVGAGATSATEPSTHALDAAGCLLLIVAASALAARRASPVPATVVATAAFLVYYGRDYPVPVLAALPATITIYTLASLSYRWPAVAATAALSVGKLVAGWVRSGDPLHSVPEMLWVSGWLVAILIWGEVTRHRRAYLHEVHQRAIDAERTREEAAQRRADEERLRIAQELHDTLTHAISVVNVQSSVALHLLHRKPEPHRASPPRDQRGQSGSDAGTARHPRCTPRRRHRRAAEPRPTAAARRPVRAVRTAGPAARAWRDKAGATEH